MLIDKNMKRQDLKEVSGISTASIAKLGKGDNITTAVLLKICNALDCDLSDIMELVEEPNKEMRSAHIVSICRSKSAR